ncbi:hypothetical protein OE88DRAFT_1735481 [Heliocybe sulcata]|uniref:DH domain-containing protein n=1 Tax=Heliocybe sulcata TaxID=5364 RepID=A0A5C3MZ05_9AGAM|nr:hypothetical protein OE88DRAFT_1735481 [Heliocybe sulcata]
MTSTPEERKTRGSSEEQLSDALPAQTIPSPPPRSPLRPAPRTRTDSLARPSKANPGSLPELLDSDTIFMPLLRHRSLGSLSGLLDSLTQSDPSAVVVDVEEKAQLDETGKPFSSDPASNSPLPLSPIDTLESVSTDASSLLAPTVNAQTTVPISKRTHALLELLSSERAYASDLALIRAVHIPLAEGRPARLQGPSDQGSSTLQSSRSSSASSSTSNGQAVAPPMSEEDVRNIFVNILDLSDFSDTFCQRLEEALGEIVEGGEGEDRVGRLFLDSIRELEKPYKAYITRHSLALSHYTALTTPTPSPSLQTYLQTIKSLTANLTHAWDIPSLLIKPVQRLLKYPLLLQTIYDETPDGHSDKANLKKAKEKMEEVARSVNENRRRWEIVKEVLDEGKKNEGAGESTVKRDKKKPGSVPLSVAASVKLGRMRSLSRKVSYGKGSVNAPPGVKEDPEEEANEEAEAVAAYESDLRALDKFVKTFAKASMEWATSTKTYYTRLLYWSRTFGRVIGVVDENDEGGRSQAFDAFVGVSADHVIPICEGVEKRIEDHLVPQLVKLTGTMNGPKKLLEAMHTLEPLHLSLLHRTYGGSGARPAPALLEASQSYVAIRGQLAEELPNYLELVEKGVRGCVGLFVSWQEDFWRDTKHVWCDLWDALREDGEELNGQVQLVRGEYGEVLVAPVQGGADVTMKQWWERWHPIHGDLETLHITKHVPRSSRESLGAKEKNGKPVKDKLAVLQPSSYYASPSSAPSTPTTPTSLLDYSEAEQRVKDPAQEALERSYLYAYTMGVTPPQKSPAFGSFTSTGRKSKVSHGAKDSTDSSVSQRIGKRPSTESFKSGKSAKSTVSGSGKSRKSHSSAATLVDGLGDIVASFSSKSTKAPVQKKSNPSMQSDRGPCLPPEYQAEELDLSGTPPGRTIRRPSFRRKWSDTIRPSSSSRREPSPAASLSRTPPIATPLASRSASLPLASDKEKDTVPKRNSSPMKKSSQQAQAPQKITSHGKSLYACRVVHRCEPPANVSYHSLPFFTLRPGTTLDILHESGHPSNHPDLPLFVDDGEDCLLLVRDRETHQIGWALASFLTPAAADAIDELIPEDLPDCVPSREVWTAAEEFPTFDAFKRHISNISSSDMSNGQYVQLVFEQVRRDIGLALNDLKKDFESRNIGHIQKVIEMAHHAAHARLFSTALRLYNGPKVKYNAAGVRVAWVQYYLAKLGRYYGCLARIAKLAEQSNGKLTYISKSGTRRYSLAAYAPRGLLGRTSHGIA